jgi:hypothetical protein
MNAKKGEHMIEERNTGVEIIFSIAIKRQLRLDSGFRCFSIHPVGSRHGDSPCRKTGNEL